MYFVGMDGVDVFEQFFVLCVFEYVFFCVGYDCVGDVVIGIECGQYDELGCSVFVLDCFDGVNFIECWYVQVEQGYVGVVFQLLFDVSLVVGCFVYYEYVWLVFDDCCKVFVYCYVVVGDQYLDWW